MTPLAAPLYIVTGVLIVAGAAKVRTPSPTAAALRELRVPKPLVAARTMGICEIVVGVVAIITGSAFAWGLVSAAYGGFTAFVLWALGGHGRVGSCGCFGHEDTPPTPGHAAFNATAAAVAGLATFEPVRLNQFDGSATEAVVAVTVICTAIALSIASLTHLPRTLSLARGTTAPTVATFAVTRSSPTRGPS